MLTWPAALPAPLWEPYGTSRIDTVERTPTDDGKFRSRPRAKKAPATVDLAVALDGPQEVLFWAFHDFALHMGTDTFLMRLRSGGQMRAMQCQFTAIPAQSELGPNAVRVAMRVLVHTDFGAVLWCDNDLSKASYSGHAGSTIHMGDVAGFVVSRAYVFCRTAPNGGSDAFAIGWSGDEDSLFEATSFPASGAMLSLNSDSASAGDSLGDGQTATKTIVFRHACTAAPSAGDVCIVVPYDDYTAP